MPDNVLTDEQIAQLLTTRKAVTNPGARWKEQRGSKQKNYILESDDGQQFALYLRQNIRLNDSFSCGLSYTHPQGGTITLTRYNGGDHEHENPLEGVGKMLPGCHIHTATERYMQAGKKSEHYAEHTDKYTDLDGALRSLMADCNIHGIKHSSELAEADNLQGDMFQ